MKFYMVVLQTNSCFRLQGAVFFKTGLGKVE